MIPLEEILHLISLRSGISQGSLREIFHSEKLSAIQKIFERNTFVRACEILGRAYISQYKKRCCNPSPEFTDEKLQETLKRLNFFKPKYGPGH